VPTPRCQGHQPGRGRHQRWCPPPLRAPGLRSCRPARPAERFADAFGIAGTPDQCIERVKELQRLVLDRIKVVPALSEEAADLEDVALSRTTMQNEVIPASRGG
jgi:alkanesulfonate monooxygenase SsuD/methylene tetrahydromethanopterin reductase-like flavin-dependent oxidoreductase (luciferase family)